MNPQSAAIAGSGNPLKSGFESEIRAKMFLKSADPFAYSSPSINNHASERGSNVKTTEAQFASMAYNGGRAETR